MKTYVFAIPTKKMDEVNWLPPLNNYIKSIYGSSNEYQLDLNGFNKLRQDLKGVNADSTGIKLYYKYYSQLELLDLRIPFNNISGKKLSFVWYDAFQKLISHKQHSLPFEKANILFNIASILSKVAVFKYEESQRTSGTNNNENGEDNTKEALQLFQQASGIFQFISENFLHAPSDDLHQSSLKFLNKLMLAQSQEIFLLKIITGDLDQKKNSLISKLCSSTSNYYLECNNMIDVLGIHQDSVSTSDFEIIDTNDELEDLENIADDNDDENDEPSATKDHKITIKIDVLWNALLHFKCIYYKSLAYYFNGLNLESSNKFGDAIANFTKSQNILNEINSVTLKQISKSGSNDVFQVLDNYKFHKDALTIKLGDLNKDNDLIYHDPIPSLVTLPDIKPLDSAKMIPMSEIKLFKEINDHNYENFLKNVVPMDIHELLSYYSEEKSQFLRNELDMVDVSNEELSSVLEYLKMPKAIVNLKEIIHENQSFNSKNSEINPEIITKVNEIAGSYSDDTVNKEKIIKLKQEIYSIINEVEAKSGNFTSSKFKDDIIKLKKSLYDATVSDDKLFGLINVDNSKLYDILGQGSNSKEFKQLFEIESTKPQSNYDNEVSLLDIIDAPTTSNNSNDLDGQIKKIEDILYDLNVIKANKQKLVDTLKAEIHNDDISDILVLNSKVKTKNEIKNVIFPEELKKFEPYANELDNLINKQKTFISNLQDLWNILSSHSKVKEIQNSKAFKDTLIIDQVTRIEQFYQNNWKRYSEGLKAGRNFYNQLLSYGKSLRDNVNNESNNDGLNDRFSNMNLSAHSMGQSNYSQGFQQVQRPPPPPPGQQQPLNQNQVPPSFASYSQPPLQPQHTPHAIPYEGQGPRSSTSNMGGSSMQNQYFSQPMLHRTLTSSSNGIGNNSYDRAPPSLPPKQPTGYQNYQPQPPPKPPSQFMQQQSTFHPPSYQSYPSQYPPLTQSNLESSQAHQTPPKAHQQMPSMLSDLQNTNSTTSNLIYDQPSTYNPNMYNFFSRDQ